MLEALDLGKRLPKADYKRRLPTLQRRLLQLQRACFEAKVGTIVVFEGWDAAGKGTTIRKLTQRLEPRGFKLYATRAPRTFEEHLPWMWRFWANLPNWGEIGIFDHSWYGRVLFDRVEGRIDDEETQRALRDIIAFERTLADDRYQIVKFFLHIDRKTEKERFEKLESDERTAWQVDEEDWKHYKQYDEYLVATERMLARTESEWAPWTLVEATDKRWTRVKVFETLIDRMEEGLRRVGHEVPLPLDSGPKQQPADDAEAEASSAANGG